VCTNGYLHDDVLAQLTSGRALSRRLAHTGH